MPVTVTERTEPPEALRWVVADLSLALLAPGDYVVELVLGESTRLTAFRVVP